MTDQRTIETAADTAAGGPAGPDAWATGERLHRLLGSAAAYLEGEIERLSEERGPRARNIHRIFTAAERKLGTKAERRGSINPRVLKRVWDEGCFCDEPLMAEYLGGVLAAARLPSGRDDRALPYAQALMQLSIYELRMHYIYYTLYRDLYEGRRVDPARKDDRQRCFVYVPMTIYHAVIAGCLNGSGQVAAIMEQAVQGLSGRGLVGPDYLTGPGRYLSRGYREIHESGAILQPSAAGAKLFLLAHGAGDRPLRDLIDPALELRELEPLPIPPGALALGPPRRGAF